MIDQVVIEEAGRRLATAAGRSAQVVVFGRGERNPSGHDHLDFLVIKPDVANEADESVRLARVLRDLRIPVDVLVVSRTHADAWRDVRGSVVHSALAHGRVVAG